MSRKPAKGNRKRKAIDGVRDVFSLALYHQSPKCYRMIGKGFALPSVSNHIETFYAENGSETRFSAMYFWCTGIQSNFDALISYTFWIQKGYFTKLVLYWYFTLHQSLLSLHFFIQIRNFRSNYENVLHSTTVIVAVILWLWLFISDYWKNCWHRSCRQWHKWVFACLEWLL